MRRYLCLFLVFSMTLTLLSPALADHSIMPGDGLMDETAAVDAAVAFLCQRLGCGEEEIRGKYYYRTLFYESGWTFKGPVWSMTVIDPTVNEDGETLVSYHYEINASTGDVLDEGKEISVGLSGNFGKPRSSPARTSCSPRRPLTAPGR